MLNYVFNKYFSNFRKLLPYLFAQVLFNLLITKIFLTTVPKTNLVNFNANSGGVNFNFNNGSAEAFGGAAIILLIITLVTGPLFAVFVRLVSRNILDDRETNQLELLKESFNYYWRYAGIVFLMILIGLGVGLCALLLGSIPFLRIIVVISAFIFAVYLFTILTPWTEYMVYDDLYVDEAFSSGKEVGKENFWSIFFFVLLAGIISGFFKTDKVQNIILISLFVFITQAIEAIKIMYVMALCKQHKEEKYGRNPSIQ